MIVEWSYPQMLMRHVKKNKKWKLDSYFNFTQKDHSIIVKVKVIKLLKCGCKYFITRFNSAVLYMTPKAQETYLTQISPIRRIFEVQMHMLWHVH